MLKALGFRVLIDVQVEEKSKGGIVIALDQKWEEAKQEIGTILDIGPGAWKDYTCTNGEPWAKVGDKVVYSKYGGKFVEDPNTGRRLMVINDSDILCKVEE